MFEEIQAPTVRSGARSASLTFIVPTRNAARSSKLCEAARQSSKSRYDASTSFSLSAGPRELSDMMRYDSWYGRPRSRAALTNVKIVLLTPTPRPSASTATAVYQRSFARSRTASRTSCQSVMIVTLKVKGQRPKVRSKASVLVPGPGTYTSNLHLQPTPPTYTSNLH